MSSRKTDPCSICGELMWPAPGTAAKTRVCQPCRRAVGGVPYGDRVERNTVCQWCGGDIPRRKFDGRTCSRSCGQKLRSAEGRNPIVATGTRQPLVECPTCGKEFRAKMMKAQGKQPRRRQRFCSRECARPVPPEVWEWRSMLPTCSDCGRCTYRGRASRVCHDCLERHKRESWAKSNEARKKPPPCQIVVECQLCGQDVSTNYESTKYCRRCRRATRKGEHRHRARKFGVAYEPINPAEIYARDNWTCHICHEEIRRVPGNEVDIDGWSLDHVIPMSKGGPHLKWNVAASHWGCNVLKGDEFFVGAA